jgi:DNA-directed RNA polymerase-3 subunit RPC5
MNSSANGKPRGRVRRDVVVADVVESETCGDLETDVPGSASSALGGSGNGGNDSDKVVVEIPVYLSPELSRQLHLIQYPLQQNPHWTAPEAARVKPRHNMVEIDYPTPNNVQLNGTYHMPSRTFISHTVPVSTHMALGKLMLMPSPGSRRDARFKKDDNDDVLANSSDDDDGSDGDQKQSSRIYGLHLVPLSRITQMRPSFTHIDESVAAASETTEDELRLQQEQRLAEQTAAQNMERKPISLQKKESERAALARKSSYGFKKASEEADPWQPLEVFDEGSEQAQTILLEQVRCPRPMDNLLQTTVPLGTANSANKSLNELYISNLNYLPPSDLPLDGSPLASSSSSQDESDIAKIVVRLVGLLHQGWPIPYSLLRAQFAPQTVTDDTLFVALGSCAVLVRGNFCLASRLMSFPSPAMTQARTFILFLFQTLRVVHRSRLEHVYLLGRRDGVGNGRNGNSQPGIDDEIDDGTVTPAVLQMLLEQVGKKTHEGWVLKVDDDPTFLERYGHASDVFTHYWAEQVHRFRDKLLRYREP